MNKTELTNLRLQVNELWNKLFMWNKISAICTIRLEVDKKITIVNRELFFRLGQKKLEKIQEIIERFLKTQKSDRMKTLFDQDYNYDFLQNILDMIQDQDLEETLKISKSANKRVRKYIHQDF